MKYILITITLILSSFAQAKIIVAFGDSLTRGGNPTLSQNTGKKGYAPLLQQKLNNKYIILNCGIGGETTRDGLARFEQIMKGDYTNCTKDTVNGPNTRAYYNYSVFNGQKPEKVLIMMGTNDLLKSISMTETLINLRTMLNIAYRNDITPYLSIVPDISDSFLNIFKKDKEDIRKRNWIIEEVAKEFKGKKLLFVDAHKKLGKIDDISWDGAHLTNEGNKKLGLRSFDWNFTA